MWQADDIKMIVVVFVLLPALLIQECQCLSWPVKLEPNIHPRQVEIPLPSDFRRRALESIAVLDNYLYIDGGEISQFVNGNPDSVQSRPVNITESIPLDQSWTNTTVTFKSIKKTAPNAKSLALWVDLDTKTIYGWGGEGPYGNTTGAESRKLWAFSPDNEGGGSWAAVNPNNPDVFSTILRGTVGVAATCNSVGFLLGGVANPASDASVSGTAPLPGLLTYDMKSATWANLSATYPYATVQNGQAACLPFGLNGLVMFLGGMYSSFSDASQLSPVLFNNLTFYDPVADEWFSQMTSGDVPENRDSFCSVGVAGPNGTFEIFMYGGHDIMATTNILSDVWVLSLPGFHWFRTSLQGTPRSGHACALVGSRQMIVVGGLSAYADPWTVERPSADPWTQGLGILDLPSLSWSDHYDPEAPAYDSPDIVKSWYSNGSLASVDWGDNKVKSMFVNESTPSSTPSSTSAPAPGQTGSRTGAIVGSLIGGIALLALVTGAVLYCRKKSHFNNASSQGHIGQYGWLGQKAELDSYQSRQYNFYPPQELPLDEMPPQELPYQAFSSSLDRLHTSERVYPIHELIS